VLQDGWTALMWAAASGRTECVKLLIKRGANVKNTANKVRGYYVI
jgi:ankyrin repeat protein